MVDIQNLESVVLSIYDATSEPSRWPRVLDTVSDIMDARGALLFDIDQRGDPSKVRTNYGPNLVKDYLDVHNAQELEDQAIFAACACRLDRTELIPDSAVSSQVKALLSKTVSRNRTQLIRLATEHSPRLFIDSSIPF
jgi:hypothetical protein